MINNVKRKYLIFIAVIFLFVIPISDSTCTNPITGKKEFNIISLKEEITLGNRANQELKARIGFYFNPKLQKYVNTIGQRLAAVSHRKEFPYYFAILDTPEINAFALPGGYVYVCRGLLELMNSEAELASVLGHEIGHVAARHGVEQLSKAYGFSLLGLGIGILLQKKGADPKAQNLINTLINLTMLGYSRKQEYQADLLSLEYTNKSGFNPMGVVKLLEDFKLIEKGTPSKLGTFFSTHPLTTERISKVKSEIEKLIKDKKAFERPFNNNIYIENIRGLYIGEKPKGGIIVKDKWISPNFKYLFYNIDGFTIKQIDKEFVNFDNKTTDEHILIEAFIGESLKSSKDISLMLEKKISTTKIEEQDMTFYKINAYKAVYNEENDGVMYVVKRLYMLNGNKAYILSYYIPKKLYSESNDKWKIILNKFKFLTAYEALSYVGDFLRVTVAKPGQNFRQIAKIYYKDEGLGKRLAIFNGEADPFYTFKVSKKIKIPPHKRLLNE